MNRAKRALIYFSSLTLAASLIGYANRQAQALPITFAPGNYDNTFNTVTGTQAAPVLNNNQTTGMFRDVFWWSDRSSNGLPLVGSPDYINSGPNVINSGNHAVPGGSFTALNFTGPARVGDNYLSILDKTPADGTATKTLFNAVGGITISTDVLFTPGQHHVAAGIVALYNEGQDGLGLLADNGGGNNPDHSQLILVFQSGGQNTSLASVALPGLTTFSADTWYRVTLDLNVTGPDSYSANGTFQNHVNGADPTSALVVAPIGTVSFSGSLSNPGNALDLTNPGEVGLMVTANESLTGVGCPPPFTGTCTDNVGVSFTNFNVPTQVSEPASLLLFGLGLLAVAGFRKSTRECKKWSEV